MNPIFIKYLKKDIDSSISIYYSNRSRCYKQKGELEKVKRN